MVFLISVIHSFSNDYVPIMKILIQHFSRWLVVGNLIKYAAVKKGAFGNSNSCSMPELMVQRAMQVWTLHVSSALKI